MERDNTTWPPMQPQVRVNASRYTLPKYPVIAVRVLKPFFVGGVRREVGEIVKVDSPTAADLEARGRAVLAK